MALALVLALAGCGSVPDAVNPASWWHHLEGGEIARQRPPPPGADQPYPNLATVPPRPAAVDQKALNKITQGLVADQSQAAAIAAASPLADPSSPAASPQLFGAGTGALPPPGPGPANPPASAGAAPSGANPGAGELSASLPAAAAPPPPRNPPPPRAAPLAPVASQALVPPSVAAATAPAMPALPKLAAAPPAPPSIAGPGGVAVPPTRPSIQPAPPAPQLPGVHPVSLDFAPGSASLPASATAPLKALAAARGTGLIAVTAGGEAAGSDPAAQQKALALGLARVQAIAAVLRGAGVPEAALRLAAHAQGREAVARLLQSPK